MHAIECRSAITRLLLISSNNTTKAKEQPWTGELIGPVFVRHIYTWLWVDCHVVELKCSNTEMT